MNTPAVTRKILENSTKFKEFWKNKGPFQYALTSREFPPVLLADEEWLFADDLHALLKELMQFDQRRMAIVRAPFNPRKTRVKNDILAPWRIKNFCDEWALTKSDIFTPVGYLTRHLLPETDYQDSGDIEKIFFSALASRIGTMGYVLLAPSSPAHSTASVHSYLEEWESEDFETGIC